MSDSSFSSLELHPALLENLSTLGYQSMTTIQAQSLPPILTGKDVIAQGKTGSGKTAAFGLGLLQKLDINQIIVQGLILCPTRELADQVTREIRKLGRGIQNIKLLTVCGGMPFKPQANSLEHGVHIVVGTPGRIEDHLKRGTLNVDNVHTLVLDEADRMLDMGFQPALDAIVEKIPQKRQTLLFSATFPEQIQSISRRIMQQPSIIQTNTTDEENNIQHNFYEISNIEERTTAVQLLLLQHSVDSAIIFCTTKRETQELADTLRSDGFSALALHGDLEQRDRDQTLIRFSNQSVSVLVATDVASRGLDIDALDLVINYHIANDTETYIHRTGRTGRAGNTGIACTLYSTKETPKIHQLEKNTGYAFQYQNLPSKKLLEKSANQPNMSTLLIDGGKKQKIRPGDILGALTGDKTILGNQVGKIHIFDQRAFVAVKQDIASMAVKKLNDGKLKGRSFRVRRIYD